MAGSVRVEVATEAVVATGRAVGSAMVAAGLVAAEMEKAVVGSAAAGSVAAEMEKAVVGSATVAVEGEKAVELAAQMVEARAEVVEWKAAEVGSTIR